MEEEEGTATAAEPTTTPTPAAASSLAPESGASASAKVEGDEGVAGAQVKVPGQEGDADAGVGAEADDEDIDPPPNDDNDEDEDDVRSEDDPMEVPAVHEQGVDEMDDDDDSSRDSEDDVTDSSSDDDEEGDADEPDDMNNVGTDNSDGESSSSTVSESSWGVSGELHPMKNPVILTNLFGLCPTSILANFRLVCKEWRDLSLDAWRSSITVNVEQNGRGKFEVRFSDTLEPKNVIVSLKTFLKYVDTHKNQCHLKPFRRFDLDGCSRKFRFPLEESKSIRMRKLWELVKRDATNLTLYWCSFPEVEVLREVIYKSCPNLRQLSLSYCSFPELSKNSPKDWSLFNMDPVAVKVYPEHIKLKALFIQTDSMNVPPLTWLEILSHFPSLTLLSFFVEEISVEGDGFRLDDMQNLLEAIQAIRKKDPRKLPLKQLNLDPCFAISDGINTICQVFSLRRELSIPLRSLKLLMGSEDEAKLHELVGATEVDYQSLRRLTFYHTHDEIATWKFPFTEPLDNIERLTLSGVIWENMEFLKLLPNLGNLELTEADDGSVVDMPHNNYESVSIISNTDMSTMTDIKLLKMRSLSWKYSLTEDDLRRLTNWFPNLTTLTAVLNDKLFTIVCEHWLGLESLDVLGSELTDEGITGLRAGQIVEDSSTIGIPPNPNITRLQKLRWFSYYGKLTDVSVFNGFLKLPRLKSLYLQESAGLSENSMAALEERKNIDLSFG